MKHKKGFERCVHKGLIYDLIEKSEDIPGLLLSIDLRKLSTRMNGELPFIEEKNFAILCFGTYLQK